MGAPENYYEAPKEGPALPTQKELPSTFTGKFSLALELYFGNFLTISAVVLTVWLPINILASAFLMRGSQDPFNSLLNNSFSNLTEAIFGPIVAGAVIWIIRQRVSGNRTRYGEAIRVGFRSWGAIFTARLVAALFILLGFIALIIPGIWLFVSYTMVDQVAAVENPGVSRSRSRSMELVRDQFWQILLVLVLTFSLGLLIFVAVAIFESYDPSGLLKTPGGNLVVACLVNIVSEIPTCLLTIYYLEAASRKPLDEPSLEESQESHPWAKPVELNPSEPL